MEEVEKKLKLRESMMFRSAIFHVVLGAQRVDAAVKSGIVSKGHIRKGIMFNLSTPARPPPRDFMFFPLCVFVFCC